MNILDKIFKQNHSVKRLLIIIPLLFGCNNNSTKPADYVGVTDIDGNVYETVQIGEQLWITENLKTTHYNNGDEILYPSDGDWRNPLQSDIPEGQYGIYNNDSTNIDIYGNLYNWYSVDDDRGVCPEGFHVPSDEEWTILIDYLGKNPGRKLKSIGTIEEGDGVWYENSRNNYHIGTNESGFIGLPTGYRNYYFGTDSHIGYRVFYWSSTKVAVASNSDTYNASTWCLNHDNSNVDNSIAVMNYGYSIRCVGE